MIQKQAGKKTIFSIVLTSFMLFALIVIGVFVLSFWSADISSDLEKNNYKFYYNKVEQKNLELERVLNIKWANKEMTKALASNVGRFYKTLEEDKPLVFEKTLTEFAINLLGEMNASGIAIAVDDRVSDTLAATYVRDGNEFDKQVTYSDISMVVGSSGVAADLDISLTDDWSPRANRKDSLLGKLYFESIGRYYDDGELEYWIEVKNGSALSLFYVQTLIDTRINQPYGIICVEARDNLILRYLTYAELSASKHSAYAIAKRIGSTYDNIFINGPYIKSTLRGPDLEYVKTYNKNFVTYSGDNFAEKVYHIGDFVAIVMPIKLSDRNSDFETESHWYTIAYIPKEEFYVYSTRFLVFMLLVVFVSLLVSFVAGWFITKRIVRPVKVIADEVSEAGPDTVIDIKPVNIQELDYLAETVMTLTKNVLDSASRIQYIMQALNLPILMIEQDTDEDKVYKFGALDIFFTEYMESLDEWPIDVRQFNQLINAFFASVTEVRIDDEVKVGESIFEYISGKDVYFIRYISKMSEGKLYHFFMDYTDEVKNRKRVVYERDHDTTTGLYNRFAFRDRVTRYIANNPKMKAAMIMWDLDDLKFVNDSHGHDFGDKYLRNAGQVLGAFQNDKIIVGRMSGDEFFAFVPYEKSRAEVIEIIGMAKRIMGETVLNIGDQQQIKLRATAGIAWYPEDSTVFEELTRYADFAMSTAKSKEKGTVADFDRYLYEEDAILITGREQFNSFIEKKETDFAFQPIVDIRTGEIFAYEALMRPTSKHITNVFDVMRIAKMQSKLKSIEIMTWNGVLSKVKANLDKVKDRRIFINSIASTNLNGAEVLQIEEDYSDLLERVVIEITESERFEARSMVRRRILKERWNVKIAIDDFGAGYSTESLLLEMMPDFVKIDMAIIRNIDRDSARQKIVENIVSYSSARGIKVVAEGVENMEELGCLKGLGVDYVQGYLVAKPNLDIVELDSTIQQKIREA